MSHDSPTGELRRPGNHVPSDKELFDSVLRRPLVSLRELCAEVWSGLPWTAAPGQDSASGTVYAWPMPLGIGAVGNRTMKLTAARYLMDRMQDLVIRGFVCCGPFSRDRPQGDLAGGITYMSAAAEGPAASPSSGVEVIHA